MTDAIRTVGHGTLVASEFAELLRGAGIGMVLDVRRYPGSRRYPWFSRDQLTEWLPEEGLSYRLIEALGGRRRPVPGSRNRLWRNEQFAAYADHMASAEFAGGMEELLRAGDEQPVAIMCSESLWWRCHRRLVADHLVLVEGRAVEHLFHDGRLAPHEPMDAAVVVDRHVEYPEPP